MNRSFLYSISLFCLFVVASCSNRNELRLLSFNIRYQNDMDTADLSWDARKDAAVRLIEDINPDIIGFQEPKLPQVLFLTESLPQYGHVETGRDEGVKPDGGEHLMIMFNKDRYQMSDSGHFWMSETPDSVSFGWDAMCRRVTVWVKLEDRRSGKSFYFFDTHFDHKGKKAREQEAILLAEKMKEIAGDNSSVFVCGDFNMESDHVSMLPVRQWMKEAREEAPDADKESTFNGFGMDRRNLKIDHVFFRNADALSYDIIRDGYGVRYVSDHYPVLARFKF